MKLQAAIPEMHVSSARAAVDFYRRLGFECDSAWRPDKTKEDPCFMSFVRDGIRVFVTSFRDGAVGATLYVYVDDVDALYVEFVRKGIPMPAPPVDQTWGTREFSVRDPDGNSLRFGERQTATA
jgi:uncharacterized glyoxalase superfamily protein PhnB